MQTIATRVPSDSEIAARSERAHTEALARVATFVARYSAYNAAAQVGNWARALELLAQERAIRSVR